MKSTGIIRRIDDLGRVVIPKEIRRELKIREGDPLELFTEGGSVIFKKYSPIPEYKESIVDLKNDMIADGDFPHKDDIIRALDFILVNLSRSEEEGEQ